MNSVPPTTKTTAAGSASIPSLSTPVPSPTSAEEQALSQARALSIFSRATMMFNAENPDDPMQHPLRHQLQGVADSLTPEQRKLLGL